MFGWSRNKAALINGVIILIASMPCVLGYNVWSNLHLIGGRDVLDSEDFMVSNLLLPIGSLVYLLFCVTKWGWGFDKYIDEANTGSGLKISRKLKPYFQFILPLLILFIFIQGLNSYVFFGNQTGECKIMLDQNTFIETVQSVAEIIRT